MNLRGINNTGSPLSLPDGTLQVNVPVTFTLVDGNGDFVSIFDALTGERVGGTVALVTDLNAQISSALWPNDRGLEIPTQYLCQVNSDEKFYGSVASGAGPITWEQFKASSGILLKAVPGIFPIVGGSSSSALCAGTVRMASSEVPDGAIDGVNVTYTLRYAPIPGYLSYSAGIFQALGVDYTLAGNVITRTIPLQIGESHAVGPYPY